MNRFGISAILAGLVLARTAEAQSDHHNQSGVSAGALSIMDPKAGSGTGWVPASSPRAGLHFRSGSWMLMVHGFAAVNYARESTPRGDQGAFSTNMLGIHLAGLVGPGRLEGRVMASAEPAMGRAGYPLLFQTGETADGAVPLVDRQHPHDLFMELAAAYSIRLSPRHEIALYAAAVGEPAIGPTVFMHRASSGRNPSAPIAHHFHDATHITYGVLTVAFTSDDRLRIEGSAFNGKEPDQDRWDLQVPRFDSYALRVTVNPSDDWSLQASIADLAEPEQLHPGISVVKVTGSVTYNRPLPDGNWQATVAWGRNKSDRTLINVAEARQTFPDPILDHYIGISELPPNVPEDLLYIRFPARSQSGLLLETALQIGRLNLFGRVEKTQKDELFDPRDARHSEVFDVGKADVGGMLDIVPIGFGRIGLGISGSIHFIDPGLKAAYGSVPARLQLFSQLTIGD